jgi:hypothetical protein
MLSKRMGPGAYDEKHGLQRTAEGSSQVEKRISLSPKSKKVELEMHGNPLRLGRGLTLSRASVVLRCC